MWPCVETDLIHLSLNLSISSLMEMITKKCHLTNWSAAVVTDGRSRSVEECLQVLKEWRLQFIRQRRRRIAKYGSQADRGEDLIMVFALYIRHSEAIRIFMRYERLLLGWWGDRWEDAETPYSGVNDRNDLEEAGEDLTSPVSILSTHMPYVGRSWHNPANTTLREYRSKYSLQELEILRRDLITTQSNISLLWK